MEQLALLCETLATTVKLAVAPWAAIEMVKPWSKARAAALADLRAVLKAMEAAETAPAHA